MIRFLKREEVINDKGQILDIGAGMENFSLEFAKSCKRVDALEVNSTCLEIISERSKEALEQIIVWS